MTYLNNNTSTVKLSFRLGPGQLSAFHQLLQGGIRLQVRVGGSVKDFLCTQFEISPEYVEKRIQTIFLDGKPVDDINKAVIKNGSTLALSAALPGLAGATLRRGGVLSSLRSPITYPDDEKSIPLEEGWVILKLFNILIKELGPIFLRKGIYITRDDFAGFCQSLPEKFWAWIQEPELNGQKIDLESLRQMKWVDGYEYVALRVL